MKADPQEKVNLIDDSGTAPPRDSLRGELRAWMQKTNDPALNW